MSRSAGEFMMCVLLGCVLVTPWLGYAPLIVVVIIALGFLWLSNGKRLAAKPQATRPEKPHK